MLAKEIDTLKMVERVPEPDCKNFACMNSELHWC